MLSICIPVYNFNVEQLAVLLHKQCITSGILFEILIADDCSSLKYTLINKKTSTLINARYIQLPRNIGRSDIRNFLCREAKFETLLFLDCDSEITSDNFISNYLPFCNQNLVVYGGRNYLEIEPESKYMLHWKYGQKRESKSITIRKVFPTRFFSSNNFLISKNILLKIPFNEKLTEYGHEDTLLAMEFYRNDILVLHIENPVIHGCLEDNEAFLKKAEAGVSNLVKIWEMYPDKSILKKHIHLVETFSKIEQAKLKRFVKSVFTITLPLLHILIKRQYNLKALDFYKLGLFCYYLDKNKKAPLQ